jgi:dolichyl-phosphate-mannose--protein O-mannosyl transferase
MSVKWNGLFFLTGIYALWGLGWVLRFWQGWRTQPSVHSDSGSGRVSHQRQGRSPSFNWLSFTQIPLLTWIVHLGIVPLLVYCLLWIPHLWLNPDMGFWELHQQILGYHQNLGSGETEHPYCSTWQSWLGMVRPISYYYQSVMPANTDGVISVQQPVVYDVHGMGNPILWWCSTIAIFLLLGLLIGAIARHLIHLRHTPSPILSGDGIAPIPDPQTLTPNTYIWFYLIVNYAANLLPWTWVSRCLFIYHYMGAGIFAIMAIALFVDYSLRTSRLELRPLGIVIILAVVMGFCIWLPLFLGLPLTPEGFQARMWLRSWI